MMWIILFFLGIVVDLYQYQRLGQTSIILLIVFGLIRLIVSYWPMRLSGDVKLKQSIE